MYLNAGCAVAWKWNHDCWRALERKLFSGILLGKSTGKEEFQK